MLSHMKDATLEVWCIDSPQWRGTCLMYGALLQKRIGGVLFTSQRHWTIQARQDFWLTLQHNMHHMAAEMIWLMLSEPNPPRTVYVEVDRQTARKLLRRAGSTARLGQAIDEMVKRHV